MKNYIFLFLSLLFLAGCRGVYTEVDIEEFEGEFILNSSPAFQGYFYEGSDSEFHYFSSRWQYGRDRYLKIATNELTVESPMEREADPVFVSPFGQDELSKGVVKIRERELESDTIRLLAGFRGDYLELDRQKFEEVFVLNSSSIYQAIHYQGSDTEYHYFSSKWDDFSDKNLKVSINNLIVNYQMGRGCDPILLSPLRQDEFSKVYVIFRNHILARESIPGGLGEDVSSLHKIQPKIVEPIPNQDALPAVLKPGSDDQAEGYTVLGKEEFEKVFILNSSSIYQAIHYQGSDTDYHYFLSNWDDFPDKNLKVPIKDLTVNHPMDRDSDPILLSPLKQDEVSKGFMEFEKSQPETMPRTREGRGSSPRNVQPRVIRPIPLRGVSTSAPQVRTFKTREELQAHLEAQQMEAIRNGKPPLPVPLTPEMERQ